MIMEHPITGTKQMIIVKTDRHGDMTGKIGIVNYAESLQKSRIRTKKHIRSYVSFPWKICFTCLWYWVLGNKTYCCFITEKLGLEA